MSSTLKEFQQFLKKISYYNHVNSLIYWDMSTITPEEGFQAQSDALTYFSTEQFRLSTSDEMKDYLDILSTEEEFAKLDDTWKFIVKTMKEDYDRDRRIPADFYEEYVRAKSESENAWEKAKVASDYSLYAPYLEKIIALTKQKIAYTHPGMDTYDVLLDTFEKGMSSEIIDRIFEELKEGLIPLVEKILAAPQPDDSIFKGYYNINQQKKVQELLLDYIGFDWKKGTVGETEHPYTLNLSSKDVRVSNHYSEENAIDPMFSSIHEGGHAIFEQHVNPDYEGTVAGSCEWMGLHESQSRFYENILGRNKNFWVPVYDKIAGLLPKFKEIPLDTFYHEINHVRNSFIRTEADEVTYCLHIIIRYEVEKMIFRDNVSVDELPRIWNKKMEEYLHITPANDAQGILQDMHWSDGSFGYFPSYLLGTIYDGMYLDTLKEELGDIDEILRDGRIREITAWLNDKIHRYGNTRTSAQVLQAVCGRDVTSEPILRHFTEKYTEVYHLK